MSEPAASAAPTVEPERAARPEPRFNCYICGDPSTKICRRCTRDSCENHLCERCGRCSDCCTCS